MKIYEFTMKEFSNLIVDILSNDDTEVILQNPNTESIFPCTVVRTPIETILLREDNVPVKKRFSIRIEEWAEKETDCMQRLYNSEEKLKKYNILKTSNDIASKDEITNKYRIINTYETIYNGLNNSFDLIK